MPRDSFEQHQEDSASVPGGAKMAHTSCVFRRGVTGIVALLLITVSTLALLGVKPPCPAGHYCEAGFGPVSKTSIDQLLRVFATRSPCNRAVMQPCNY